MAHGATIEFLYSEYSDIPPDQKFDKKEYQGISDVYFEADCSIDRGESGYSDSPDIPRYVDYCEFTNICVYMADGMEVDYGRVPFETIDNQVHKQLIQDVYQAYQTQIEDEALGN